MKRNLFTLLGFASFAWAAWSLFRWLFMPSYATGNYLGWEWILSIAIEVSLGFWFFNIANNSD